MAAPSHQYILRCANESLGGDPAYEGSNFPDLEEILRFEGVEVDSFGNKGGPGPDNSSPYSGHDYNPRTNKGRATTTAADWYDKLKYHLLLGHDAAQDAAYLAHYVADISCPYHINGMPADEALKLRPTGRILKLDDSVIGTLLPRGTGPMGGSTSIQIPTLLTYWPASLPASVTKRGNCGRSAGIDGANWTSELGNWTNIYNNDNNADWFDPWYSDGMAKKGYEESSSTHTFWELYAFENCSPVRSGEVVKATRYSNRFAQKGNGNKKNMDNHIKNIAIETLKQQKELLVESAEGDPGKSLGKDSKLFSAYKRAIEDVYTAWRASFSALRPDMALARNLVKSAFSISLSCLIHENIDNVDGLESQIGTN
jgi:hypothetical protein